MHNSPPKALKWKDWQLLIVLRSVIQMQERKLWLYSCSSLCHSSNMPCMQQVNLTQPEVFYDFFFWKRTIPNLIITQHILNAI